MAFQRFVLIEPITGGSQQVESTSNFLKWKKVMGPDKKPLEDHRETFGGNIYRIVTSADDPKDLTPTAVGPLIPASLPIPKLPPEVVKEVASAPIPALPELDPAGDPVRPSAIEVTEPNPASIDIEVVASESPSESKAKKPGRPKKVTA